MSDANKDPLHGITLEKMLTDMVGRFGWEEMGRVIPVRCFTVNPSIKSSLAFLRKTPWARKQLEEGYASTFKRPAAARKIPHEPGIVARENAVSGKQVPEDTAAD